MSSRSKNAPARVACGLLLVGSLAMFAAARADAGTSTVPDDYLDELMAGSLDEPVGICEVPDRPPAMAPRVLFVEQRTARVGLVVGSAVYTVGTVPGVESFETERGLLGIAVDPGWPARPYFYIHCTDNRSGNHIAISRFTLTGDLDFTGTGQLQFDASSRYDLLTDLPDNAAHHNGGTVRFALDGGLYVSLGDDGTRCPALDITRPVGKILRLDTSRLPSTPGGPPPTALLVMPGNPYVAQGDSSAMLVWTYGLRNPFRFSVDAKTGELYVGDVGESRWEELDRVTKGGLNMGWPLFEGPASFMSCFITTPSGPTPPIYYYNHIAGVVIIPGGLYRRPSSGAHRFPLDYDGDCFLVDYGTGFMRRLKFNGSSWMLAPPVPGQPSATDWGNGFDTVPDMLELSDGSLWYCRQFPGELRRITPLPVLGLPDPGGVALALDPARPTPSQGSVTLAWSQPARERVRLEIFDPSGRRVAILEDGATLGPGRHQREWNGRERSGAPAAAGVYLVRLDAGPATRLARITLLR